jgi:hypothetical protein
MASLKLDQWKGRWSFARGATKATHRTKGQSMTELTEALAEVDGLLAGINYLEKVEPDSEEIPSLSASNENSNNFPPPNPATASWFGHLAIDLPQLGALGSEERSKIEPRHLRSILNDRLVNSNDESRQIPRESQWATIRSLRKASMLHYNQFAKVTADSTNADIRKLRKSYVTAKKLLEMGILTFRQVLHGQNPTTLVDIFSFASLSYVISKTLHAKGHIDESDILSGILDWRAAITDERERSAFDDIAGQLWPEAKEIMHFIPLERAEISPETAGLRRDGNEARYTTSFIPQEAMQMRALWGQRKKISHLETIRRYLRGLMSMCRLYKRAHLRFHVLVKWKILRVDFRIISVNLLKKQSRTTNLRFRIGSTLTAPFRMVAWTQLFTRVRYQILAQKFSSHCRRGV